MALLISTLCAVGCVWLLGMWVVERIASQRSPPKHGSDPIVGPRDRIAIYDTGGPFIPMPERLKTRDEMVAWMTTELPKLTAKKLKPGLRDRP